jgi:hypothetical protein
VTNNDPVFFNNADGPAALDWSLPLAVPRQKDSSSSNEVSEHTNYKPSRARTLEKSTVVSRQIQLRRHLGGISFKLKRFVMRGDFVDRF